MSFKLTFLGAVLLIIFTVEQTQGFTRAIGPLTMRTRVEEEDLQGMSKRSAAAINHLILEAVRRDPGLVFENENREEPVTRSLSHNFLDYYENKPHLLNLQRRGPRDDRRRYIRCYFNVVSCF